MSPFLAASILFLSLTATINAISYLEIITGSDFKCDQTGQCETRILKCLPNQPCNIVCSGDYSCRNTKVLCPSNEECTVTCTYPARFINPTLFPPQVCFAIIIEAKPSNLLTVHSLFGKHGNHSSPRHMEYAKIYCPAIGRENCRINCHGNDLMRQVDVFANEGFNDVVFNRTHWVAVPDTPTFNAAPAICMRNSIMHCASEPGDVDFGAECRIASQNFIDTKDGIEGFKCAERDPKTCETMLLPTLEPTTASPTSPLPTISSTSIPSSTMDPLSSTSITEEPFKQAEPGLTDTQLALVIVLPTIAVLCIILILAMVFKMKSDNDKLGGGSYTRRVGDEEENEKDGDGGDTNTEQTGLIKDKETWSDEPEEDDGMIDVGMSNHYNDGSVENGDYETSPMNISKNDHDIDINGDNDTEIHYKDDALDLNESDDYHAQEVKNEEAEIVFSQDTTTGVSFPSAHDKLASPKGVNGDEKDNENDEYDNHFRSPSSPQTHQSNDSALATIANEDHYNDNYNNEDEKDQNMNQNNGNVDDENDSDECSEMRRSRFPITYQITEQHRYDNSDDTLPSATPTLIDFPSNATNPALRTPSAFSIASTAHTNYTYSTINTTPSLCLQQSNTRDNISEEDAIFADMLSEILNEPCVNEKENIQTNNNNDNNDEQLPKLTPKLENQIESNESDMSSNEILMCLNFVPVKPDYDSVLKEHGYKKMRKITSTLQGEIYECVITDEIKKNKANLERVAIKRTSKNLHKTSVASKDSADLTILVEEDIIKEAMILKYLTKDNRPNGGYIAKYIDFFSTPTDYYLVTEYVGTYNLSQFVKECHSFIKQKRLKLNAYKKIIKFLFWQICVMIHWMHYDMKCCHLDLTLDNIIVRDGDFQINEETKEVIINPNVAIKLADFGMAEVFEPNAKKYLIAKWGLKNSFEYTPPEVYQEKYFDGFMADIWSLGSILFKMSTGKRLYSIPDEQTDVGYNQILYNRLDKHFESHHFNKYIPKKAVVLMKKLLNVNEKERYSAIEVIKCEWFTVYYGRYAQRIEKKSKAQAVQLKQQQNKMRSFPYYNAKMFGV